MTSHQGDTIFIMNHNIFSYREERIFELRRNNEPEEETEAEFDAVKEVLEQSMEEDKHQLLSLQDSLTASRNEQLLDVGDIWRYLHKERGTEWLTESQGTSLSISADSLREKVAKEIRTLKTQLVRSEAALQALEGRALPAALSTASYKYKTVGDSLLETLSLGDLCDDSVIGASKLDSASCPHLDHKHNASLTQTEAKTKTSCLVQKRRAPHVKNSKYALLNSSTGSSTSGVDVSSISSRSDSQHKSVCILETPIDCPSSPDDSDNPLVRQRSQSFRLAIERGASIDSSLLSCDTSPDLSPQCTYPPSYTDYLNKDQSQHSAALFSRQFINPAAHEHRDKTEKSEQSNHNSHDTTRSQKSRIKQELGSKTTDFKVEMNSKSKEVGLPLANDDTDSPHSRRLSTLVEESDQETEEFHSVHHLHSPGSPLSPSYLRGSSKKHRTQSLPRYKEPPSYKDIIHNHSKDGSQMDDNRPGHQRSRSLSPDHHHVRTSSPGCYTDVTLSNSLPASPQIIAQNQLHKAKLEFKPAESGLSLSESSKVSEKITHPAAVGSVDSDNYNETVNKEEALNNNITRSKYQRSGDLKARRKSLHDMRQSSSNVLLNNNAEDNVTDKMEEKLLDKTVQNNTNAVVTSDESSKFDCGHSDDTKASQRRDQHELCGKPSTDICQTTEIFVVDESHSKDNITSDEHLDKDTVQCDSNQSENQQVLRCSSQQSLPKHDICPQETNIPSTVSINHLTKIREDNLAKRKQLQKQSTAMPDLAEVTGGEHGRTASHNVGNYQGEEVKAAFPSLSDVFLEKMKLLPGRKDKLKTSLDQTPEQEIEDKFVRLSLAFKTDKLTLEKRVELHQRARDVAEQNIEEQLDSVKEALKVLGPLCKDVKSREVFSKIEHHVDVLGRSTTRMSSRAEVLGAVKQEYRISEAIEVMIQHVENLKQSLEREHIELEEAKRLLMESRHGGESDPLLHRRSLSITSHASKVGRRRASVAVPPKAPVLPPAWTKSINATTDDVDTKNNLETSSSSPTLCTLSLPLVLDGIPTPAPVHRPSTEHSTRESQTPSNSQSINYDHNTEQGTSDKVILPTRKREPPVDSHHHHQLHHGDDQHHHDDIMQLSDVDFDLADGMLQVFPDPQMLLDIFHYLAVGLLLLLGLWMILSFVILEDIHDLFYLYFKYTGLPPG